VLKMDSFKEIESITKEDVTNYYWYNKKVFYCEIQINDNIESILKDIIEDDDCFLIAEYWEEANVFHYYLIFDDDTANVTDKLRCEYLNNLVLDFINNKRGV